jgi:hypothetical protein
VNESKWVISIEGNGASFFWWEIYLRSRPMIRFGGAGLIDVYTRRDSAIRGAKRMAKRLRIHAEVE